MQSELVIVQGAEDFWVVNGSDDEIRPVEVYATDY